MEVDRRCSATDLLGGDRCLLHPELRAAAVHLDQKAGDPLVSELAVNRLVLPGLGVHHAADALYTHVLGEKTGNRISEQLLRLRQSKVHVGLLWLKGRRGL